MAKWSRVQGLYGRLIESAQREAAGIDLPERLYISRRDTKSRVMTNEPALEEELARRGVAAKLFATMSVAEQIATVAGARMIVAPHGAGLAHLILARPGTTVLEMIPSSDGSHSLRFNFARISYLRGHRYTAWLEPVNVLTKNWDVEMPAFLELFDRVADTLQPARESLPARPAPKPGDLMMS